MVDRLTVQRRSWNMSRIRGRDTKPELTVRSLLHRMGFRFRLHVRQLPGCPDIVLRRRKAVIFVHGCFWHRHHKCPFAYTPKSRTEFWLEKLKGNVARDRKALLALRREGWKPLIVWECELQDEERLARKLREQLQ